MFRFGACAFGGNLILIGRVGFIKLVEADSENFGKTLN